MRVDATGYRDRAGAIRQDPWWVRVILIGLALAVITLLVVIPVLNVFSEALAEGFDAYWTSLFEDPDTAHAILLTATVVPVVLAANLVFGVAAAWAISRFSFPGRTMLTTLIDLPFSVSPVVAGLMFVLIFGLQGYAGGFLARDGYSAMPYATSVAAALVTIAICAMVRPWKSVTFTLLAGALVFAVSLFLQLYLDVWPKNTSLKIIFATPGLILATAFVTFPFIARELLPLMDAIGPEEELAAVSLGANGWQMFWHVTLPNIKWGLVYGIILCNARAMGEFGAVYVVSGHIAGQTDTMPLRIEKLFQEYNLPGSFAVASVLTSMAILSLIVKSQIAKPAQRESATEHV